MSDLSQSFQPYIPSNHIKTFDRLISEWLFKFIQEIPLSDWINIVIAFFTSLGVLLALYFSWKSLQELKAERIFTHDTNILSIIRDDVTTIRKQLHLVTAHVIQLHYIMQQAKKEDVYKKINRIGNKIDDLAATLWSTDHSLFSNGEDINEQFIIYKVKFSEYISAVEKYLEYKFRFIAIIGEETFESNRTKVSIEDLNLLHENYIKQERTLHELLIKELNKRQQLYNNKHIIQ